MGRRSDKQVFAQGSWRFNVNYGFQRLKDEFTHL